MSDHNGHRGRLSGKVALVTGASRGLGAAIAIGLAAEGAHLIIAARTVGGLEETDDSIRQVGSQATLVPIDLRDHDKIDHLALGINERFGRLDILVGSAAILGMLGPMGHTDPKLWNEVMELNVTANWRLIRALDPALRASPAGRAIFTTCSAGHEPVAYWNAYAVSKAALEMMVRVWEAELRLTNIKVSLIDPGPVSTRLRATAFPGEDRSLLKQPAEAIRRFIEAAI